MEGTLLVTPERLQSTANSFNAKATQVKALHDSMLSKIKATNSVYTGNAADAYRAKFTALQASMEKINRMINEHVTDLNAMAEQYASAETTARNIAEELPASTLD